MVAVIKRNSSEVGSPTDTSHSIREAALRLFATHGYPTVGLRQLADEVGIHAGSLYNHIAGKQDLLFDLIEEGEYFRLHSLKPAKRGKKSPTSMLISYVQDYLQFIHENRDHHTIAHRDSAYLSDDQKRTIQAIKKDQDNVLQHILIMGNSQGVFNVSDTTLTSGLINSLLEGAIAHLAASNISYAYAKEKIGPIVLCTVGYRTLQA